MAKRKSVKQDEVEINLSGSKATIASDSELGQIRSLLFGQHAEETLQRVDRIEREITGALTDLIASVDARFDAVDERIAAETEARTAGDAKLQDRITSQSTVAKNAQIDLRTSIERSAAEFGQQLGATRSELQDHIETVDADLRDRSVDRDSLAGLFEQVATKLGSSES